MRKVLLICLLLSTITSWSQTPWYELANNPNATINEIETAYNQQVKGLSEEKKAAYAKHFERWYAAIAPYILPDGYIQNRAELYNRNALITSHKQSPDGNWKEIGPFTARDISRGVGRINCIAFHPTDSNIMYCGAPLGGVWKTVNHGETWEPLTDHIPNFFVTAIAVNPGNPDIIYAGTGDGNTETRYPGIGLWKSQDGGINWEQKSDLIGDQIVNDIIVHPDDNDRVIAAAHNGLYLTESGGNKWVRLVTGRFRELRMAPDNNDIIYASTNSTLMVSTDGGFRFTGKRLPRTPNPRLVIAVSAAEPKAIWLVSEQLVLKSDNYGDDIYEVLIGDGDRDLGAQSWYNSTAEGSPHEPGVLYQGHVPVYKTGNNGKSWKRLSHVHSDVHYMRHSPVTGRLWLCGDGGVVRLNDDGVTFSDYTNMGVSQIYSMSQHPTQLDHMLNGYQDCGSKYYVGNQWISRVGADGMDCVFDPDSPDIYFTTIQFGDIRRHFGGPNGRVSNFPDPQGNKENERGPWESPIVIDKANPATLYTAQHSIYRYANAREDNPKRNRWQDLDNGLPIKSVTRSGAYLDLEQNEAATNTWYTARGFNLYRTRNMNTKNPLWEDLSDGYQKISTILDIEHAGNDSNLVFMSQTGTVYRSDNGGDSFYSISQGLPNLAIRTLQYDYKTDHLYAGCDVGVYVLPSGASEWQSFSNGLSLVAPVHELEIFFDADNHDNSMIKAATFGRGMWESSLLGSQPDPTLPFYAILKSNYNLLEQEEFVLDVSFRRGYAFVDVKDFTNSDFVLTNCQVEKISGKNGVYQVTLKALAQGVVAVQIPSGVVENASVSGQLNFESERIEFNFLKDGTHFGYEGPGGVGSKHQIAIWLDADDLALNNTDSAEIHVWNDHYRNWKGAFQDDTLNGPFLYPDDSLLNGHYSLKFDSSRLSKIVIDSMMTSLNLSVVSVALSDQKLFNEHGWIASSRDENGYMIHPWKEHNYCRMFAYDSTAQNERSEIIEVEDARYAHIYGLSYRNNIYIWNYTDDTAAVSILNTPKPRKDSLAIDVKLGNDQDDRWGDGRIACHLVYNEALMLTHRTLVYNYLASKYNLPIPDIDKYFLEEEFPHHIAGIGKESEIDLHTDARGTGWLRVSNPSDFDNGEYLMWGSNEDGAGTWSLSGFNDFESNSLTWRFQETGPSEKDEDNDVGDVTLQLSKEFLNDQEKNYYLVSSNSENQQILTKLVENEEGYYGSLNVRNGQEIKLYRKKKDEIDNALNVFPNPITDGWLRFEFESTQPDIQRAQIEIFDLKGRSVLVQDFDLNPNSVLHYVDISKLINGMYILQSELDGEVFRYKFEVSKF